jgi:hypothetical protein
MTLRQKFRHDRIVRNIGIYANPTPKQARRVLMVLLWRDVAQIDPDVVLVLIGGALLVGAPYLAAALGAQ